MYMHNFSLKLINIYKNYIEKFKDLLQLFIAKIVKKQI